MANFIKGTEINLALESMIREADDFLWFISPYIKLHERIKDQLKRRKDDDKLQIVVVFGKNENDVSKSLSDDDLNFLTEFPNVRICYEKNLHAKYYASEDCSLITSMNLHEFSHNTNIEVGIWMKPKSGIKQLTNMVIDGTDMGDEAMDYFSEVIDHSEEIFCKLPEYKAGFLGMKKTYVSSKVETDRLDEFFRRGKRDKSIGYRQNSSITQVKESHHGYCIRTGVKIDFNPQKPLSNEAYRIWSQYGDGSYPENYCHFSGEQSFGKTSFAEPVLRKNRYKAQRI